MAEDGFAPTPKFQLYVAPKLGVPIKLISDDCPAHTLAGEVKSYTPAAFITTDVEVVELHEEIDETVKLIFLDPTVDHCREYGPALEPLKI